MANNKHQARAASAGNYVAEWFGHRVWPFIDTSPEAVQNQSSCLCPFLSRAKATPSVCIKEARGFDEPTGVCTISSDSNSKTRQDWLACPIRTLDADFTLLAGAIRTTYCVPAEVDLLVLPVTVLHLPEKRQTVKEALATKRARVFAFSGSKVGGEVDMPETEVSPGGKVDVSVIEVLGLHPLSMEPTDFGQHMLYEIQTADFHGSPLHAVRKLRELCPRHPAPDYHARLEKSKEVAGHEVEGPNKANIFKRTVYQLIIKIQLTQHTKCAGFVMVLPLPVWESWFRHLGRPEMKPLGGDPSLVRLVTPADRDHDVLEPARAWIFVFDIDRESKESPLPLKVIQRVATTSAALVHYAFQTASEQAIAQGVIEKYRQVLQSRVTDGWYGRRPDQKK